MRSQMTEVPIYYFLRLAEASLILLTLKTCAIILPIPPESPVMLFTPLIHFQYQGVISPFLIARVIVSLWISDVPS